MKTPTVELFVKRSGELSLLETMLQTIVVDAPPDASPASRSKQFTVVAIFYSLKTKGIPLSLTTLTEMTGMTRKAAQEAIDPLIERGFLTETWGRTSLGRGKAKLLHFTAELLEKLETP